MKTIKTVTFLVLALASISCSTDLDDNLEIQQIFEEQETIAADSNLFENLKEIASDDPRAHKTITCINFIYPITLFVFNEANEYVSTSTLSDDDEFSNFLEPIDESFSISISFPITATLETGEEFTVNNKEELKESIDQCLDVEIIGECTTLIRECLWKVGYSFNSDNEHLGDKLQESDGFLTLNTEDTSVIGSWTPFVIESELHININVIDSTAIGEYYNYDWKAEYIDSNSLKLTYQERELILNQRCDPDFDLCGNFEFNSCEIELNGGIAEFMLTDYTFCILDTLEMTSDDNITVSFYESDMDAENLANAISQLEPYLNTDQNQILFVRVDTLENDEYFILEIKLIAESC